MHETFWSILLSPAHTLAEIFWTIVLDVLIVGLVWPKIRRRIKHEHRVIDAEHGYSHEDPHPDEYVDDISVQFLLTDLGWAAQR